MRKATNKKLQIRSQKKSEKSMVSPLLWDASYVAPTATSENVAFLRIPALHLTASARVAGADILTPSGGSGR